MNEISNEITAELVEFLNYERPHKLRAVLESAAQDMFGAVHDGKAQEADVMPLAMLVAEAAANLSKAQAGIAQEQSFITAVKRTGRIIVKLRRMNL